jgi:hypothetical protein
MIAESLPAGTYHFVVENHVGNDALLFAVLTCEAGDPSCE